MKLNNLLEKAYKSNKRLVAPLAGFPGVNIVETTIKIAQQNYGEHFKVIRKIADEFNPDIIFPLMDLSVEANATGRYTIFPKNDSATVPKDKFNLNEIEIMKKVDISKDTRLLGYVETVKLMSENLPKNMVIGAYVTGPYTLSALIMGADEAAIATIVEKEKLRKLLEFSLLVILKYTEMLISVGAELICVLEPTAVMLGPEQFEEFSSNYIKDIVKYCRKNEVSTVYHTCGNTMHLIKKMEESGVDGLSLDSEEVGVDLHEVAHLVKSDIAIIGNISPVHTMLKGTPEELEKEVFELMSKMNSCKNYILSTGCDLPQETPIENIRAFMGAGRKFSIV
jgi:uroporphyrinogen decarboxylase